MDNKIRVTFFQRRPRKEGNFSIEHIFSDLRKRLKDRIVSDVKISKFYNDGVFTKVYNICEAALKQGGDVTHVTGELHFLNLLMTKKRVVLTIHDCLVIDRKKGLARYMVKLLYLTLPVNSSNYITANSEFTKQEIIRHTNCRPEKIRVIPVGVDSIFQPHPKAFQAGKPNILHIGLSENKNIFRLIESLKGIDCHLSIIGKLTQTHIDALKKNFIEYSYSYNLTASEMLEKYKECDILAFVSTFEGFGMPIIEANSVERVVLTSNLSSMPEVAGDAAHLVDPFNTDAIRNGIIRLINEKDYRKELIDRGRRNKKRFDPDDIANSYYNLYCTIRDASEIAT